MFSFSAISSLSSCFDFSDISSDFDLKLILSKTTFRPGEKIPFEVKIENPHGVLLEYISVSMMQTTIRLATLKKRRFSSSASHKAFKVNTSHVMSENAGAGFHDTTWFGYLTIPMFQSPTIFQWEPPFVDDVIENRYTLQVCANHGKNYSLKSQEYPIRIEHTTSSLSPQSSLTPGTSLPSIRRAASASVLTPIQSPNLSLLGPPSYLSLSPDSTWSQSDTISRSYETLPPNYEDLGTTYFLR